MIRINLAKKTGKQAAGGFKFDFKALNIAAFLASLKGGDSEEKKFNINGPIPKAIMAIMVCYYVDGTLAEYRAEELKKVDAQIAAVEKEKTAIQAKLAKIKGFEPIKKQLEDDEKAIRTKLEVVNKLLEDRNAPSKMMLQVAQSIPDEVWLTEFSIKDDKVKLAGQTPGYNQVSDFIRSLNGTSQFTDIKLSGIQENSQASAQRIQTFDLTAMRRKSN